MEAIFSIIGDIFGAIAFGFMDKKNRKKGKNKRS